MFIAGREGKPVNDRLGYVLPVVRVDFRRGTRMDDALLLADRFRGLSKGRPDRAPLKYGVSDGGEGSLPLLEI